MSNKSENNNDNMNNIPEYFDNNDDKRRNHRKYRDYDNFNNKNSILTFLSSIIEKNQNFSLSSNSPEEIIKIYNCYVSNENFSMAETFDNNSIDCTKSLNSQEDSNESSTIENDDFTSDDHFALKNPNINILNDIQSENQADAREFIFSYFEILNSPLLSTKAFSIMVIESDHNQIIPKCSLYSILFNKFLANTGSLEVFLDHYATLINPFEARTYKTNKDFIESRILQIKSLTTLITCYPSLISRMSKIIKKFGPSLFSLLKQSDISTSIEAFRCIVSIYNCKENIIKKKTKRKWLPKLINTCLPDSPLFPLIMNFATNQKMIKFELSNITNKIIDKSTILGNRKKKLIKREKVNDNDDYISCSEIAPDDDTFFGVCTLETLNLLESTLYQISRNNKVMKIIKKVPSDQLNNTENSLSEQDNVSIYQPELQNNDNDQNDDIEDLNQTFTYLFNVAIEDSIFGRAAIEVIRNVLISFSKQSTKIAKSSLKGNAENNSNSAESSKNESKSNYHSPFLTWPIFMLRKSIVMFAISERLDNFTLFERRCRSIENLCVRICETDENGDFVSEYVTNSIKRIVRTALLCKKSQLTRKKEKSTNEDHLSSICHLAMMLGIDKNNINIDDVDKQSKTFLSSLTSELIEAEELTQFVHFPFDEAIDRILMEY